jgi:predicted O-linked N-acetylglucosamine transferase (SPINDLY family)
VEIAVALAQDPTRLESLRTTLRQRVAASPLCDGQTCAEALAIALRQMWTGADG